MNNGNKLLQVCDMSFMQKEQFSKMNGDLLLWICEGRSIGYMSVKLGLRPEQVEHNIDEMLYILRKRVGIRRFIKSLFIK